MGRPTVDFYITFDGHRCNKKPFKALVDTGAAETIIPSVLAEIMKLGKLKPDDTLYIMGEATKVCHLPAEIVVKGTDCHVEMVVAVVTDPKHDVLAALLGADFLERTGSHRWHCP